MTDSDHSRTTRRTASPGRPLRFGILGAAAIAPSALIRPSHRHPSVEVTAIAARDTDRARRFAGRHGIPRVLGSYEELLADPDLDAVYVPSPNGLHGVWTKRAIEAGKHVLCEKPFTANADEAREVAARAADSDRVVMEAFHWRYHPMARRLLEIAGTSAADDVGELGAIQHVEASFCFPLLRPGDIRYRGDLAGGALMDAGCYAVHMVRSIIGLEPEVVSARAHLTRASATEPDPGLRVDRALTGDLRFPGGISGRVTCSMLSHRLLAVRVRVSGTGGEMVAVNPLMPKLGGSIRVRLGDRRRIEVPARTATYDHQLDAFVAAAGDGRPFPTDPADAVRNMEVIDQLYRAAGLAPRHPTPLVGRADGAPGPGETAVAIPARRP